MPIAVHGGNHHLAQLSQALNVCFDLLFACIWIVDTVDLKFYILAAEDLGDG